MKLIELPSQEYLLECFSYDPKNGLLIWKERPIYHFKKIKAYKAWNSRFKNTLAGSINKNGYWHTAIYSKIILHHRIIWKIMTSNDPPETIDHIDNNKLNNSFSNLRCASNQENQYNRNLTKANKTGYKGVSYYKERNKYVATIKFKKISYNLGYFDCPKSAHEAYCEAAKKYHGDFFNSGHPLNNPDLQASNAHS